MICTFAFGMVIRLVQISHPYYLFLLLLHSSVFLLLLELLEKDLARFGVLSQVKTFFVHALTLSMVAFACLLIIHDVATLEHSCQPASSLG